MRVVLDDGSSFDLGETEATPTIGIIDYSRRETDDFGVTTVVERGFARRMSVRLIVPFDQVDALQRTLADVRAKPAQWVADDRFAWLNFRGFYKEFEIDLALPPISYCTLTVEGLVAEEAFTDDGSDPSPSDTASSLLLLQPVRLKTEDLLASNVPEQDYPEWVAATTYPLGERVIRSPMHRIYESSIPNNLGNDPPGESGKWTDIGPTNRWAMFDEALGSETTRAGSVVITVQADTISAIALLDAKADTIKVEAGAYVKTSALGADGSAFFLDVPVTSDPVTVTITSDDGRDVSVGTLLLGTLVGLGETLESPKASIADFSRKDVDDFGEVTVVERATRILVRAVQQPQHGPPRSFS